MGCSKPLLESPETHGLLELHITLPMLGTICTAFALPHDVANVGVCRQDVIDIGVVDGEAPVASASHLRVERNTGTKWAG